MCRCARHSSVQFSSVISRSHPVLTPPPARNRSGKHKVPTIEYRVSQTQCISSAVRAGYAAVLACPSSIWYIVFTHGLLRMTLFVFSLNDDWMMAIPG